MNISGQKYGSLCIYLVIFIVIYIKKNSEYSLLLKYVIIIHTYVLHVCMLDVVFIQPLFTLRHHPIFLFTDLKFYYKHVHIYFLWCLNIHRNLGSYSNLDSLFNQHEVDSIRFFFKIISTEKNYNFFEHITIKFLIFNRYNIKFYICYNNYLIHTTQFSAINKTSLEFFLALFVLSCNYWLEFCRLLFKNFKCFCVFFF